jgi:hypothetical protein
MPVPVMPLFLLLSKLGPSSPSPSRATGTASGTGNASGGQVTSNLRLTGRLRLGLLLVVALESPLLLVQARRVALGDRTPVAAMVVLLRLALANLNLGSAQASAGGGSPPPSAEA